MFSWLQKYLLPGLVFQGVVIGGGYAMGREIAEFFLSRGPLGGLLAIGVLALIWSVAMAYAFELCRMTRSYDYKTFFEQLLGRYWFLYEWLFFLLIVLVLSVIGAATGEIISGLLSISTVFGTTVLFIAIALLAFIGSDLIEKFMGVQSVMHYLCYFGLVASCIWLFGEDIKNSLGNANLGSGWLLGGVRYTDYNLATVLAVFFCLTHLQRRSEALIAGALASMIGILPGIFLFIAMLLHYPEIVGAVIPAKLLLEQIHFSIFSLFFQVILLGTLVQTGVGLVHSVNERTAVTLREKNVSCRIFCTRWLHCHCWLSR